jgi:hypothetical protein
VAALSLYLPPAFDFHTVFRPVVWEWLRGERIYTAGRTAYAFLNPPWTLPLLLPFALPPEPVGRALLFVFTVAVVVLAVRSARRRVATLMTLVSFPFLALVWNGQLEGLPLLGICLGAWAVRHHSSWALSAALVLMGTKPQGAGLALLLLLWHARSWHWRDWARIAALPALALGFALGLFGLDWVEAIAGASGGFAGDWVNTSWPWRFVGPSIPAIAVGWSVGIATLGLMLTARRPLSRYSLSVIVTANTLASPYVVTHHLILPLAVAWPWLLDRRWQPALVVYAMLLSPLLRSTGDQALNWLDFVFPLALMAALLGFYSEAREKEELCG